MSELKITQLNRPFDEHLGSSLQPNLFYSPAWIDVLARQYRYDFFKVELPRQHNFLVIARVQQIGFSKLKALPFCDYIIPSVENAEALNQLIEGLKKHFPNRPLELKIVLPNNISPEDLNHHPLKHSAYRHTVDTTPEMQKIEDNMDNSFMRGVRKANKQDVHVSRSRSKEALDHFYEIYRKQRIEKFEKLPQPYGFLEKIHENFLNPEHGFFLQAEKDSAVIASMLILEYGKQLYYKFGCSRQQYLNDRPNNLLFYQLFEYAHEHNFEHVDLGLSGVSDDYAGLVRFKEYMGGQASNIYSLRFDPSEYEPADEYRLKEFTSALTEIIVAQNPDEETTNHFSKILYPYFA